MKKHLLATAAFCIAAISVGYSKVGQPTSRNSVQTHTQPSFIENKGQITDQYFNSRPDVQYSIKATAGLSIFIGDGTIHYQFADMSSLPAKEHNPDQKYTIAPLPAKKDIAMYRMDVELVGADKNAQVSAAEEQSVYETYFTSGTDGTAAVAHKYNKLTYKNVYPHIDWVLHTGNGQLKHEFVVNEGGHAADIQLKYGGATHLQLNADGSLTATTPQGTITEQAPASYQADGSLVKSSYRLSNNVVSYNVAHYSGTLVVDLNLQWATHFGGSSEDEAASVATDASGNVYMVGYTRSLSNIATSGAWQATFAGGFNDAYLSKFNSAGNRQWTTYYGGTDMDDASGVATDAAGNIYIAGTTHSTSGIATAGAYQTALADSGTYPTGAGDAFLAKFNSSGTLAWGTYFGGNSTDYCSGLAVDATGSAYITGGTYSRSGLTTPGAWHTTPTTDTFGDFAGDAFVAKFNATGAIQWSTYFGGDYMDIATAAATDYTGNVYITGTTTSTHGLATTGAHQTTFADTTSYPYGDAFLAKFSGAGSLLWATYYGGERQDVGLGVATDTAGSCYITGYTISSSGIATPSAYQPTWNGGYSGFLAKFSNTGTRQWATYYGGNIGDVANCVTTDTLGNIYVGGGSSSTSGLVTPDGYQTTPGDVPGTTRGDAFLANFTSTGSLLWATYLGGEGYDQITGAAADGAGHTYVCGTTNSTSGLATFGAYQVSTAGNIDGFLARFNFCQTPVVPAITGAATVCVGTSITLTNTATGGTWETVNSNASVSASGVVTSLLPGVDTIRYTVSNGCGSTTVIKQITSDASAGPLSVDTGVCVGGTFTLGAVLPGGVWSLANGNATITSLGVVTGVSAGVDTIIYTNTNICGTATTTASFAIHTLLDPGSITGPSSICLGTAVTLHATVSGGAWTMSNANAWVTPSGLITSISAGTDTAIYAVTNVCGTTTTSSSFTIHTFPVVPPIAGLGNVCVGANDTFAVFLSSGVWSLANANATITPLGVATGVSAGTNTVSYTVTNVCGADTSTAPFTVNPLPDAGLVTGQDSVCVGDSIILSATAVGGNWGLTNPLVSVTSGGVVRGLSPGTDTIIYNVTNTCGIAATQKTVTVVDCTTGINTVNSNVVAFDIFPNPATSEIHISSAAAITNVAIHNVLGQSVFGQSYNSNKVAINLSGVPAGVYLVKINGDKVYRIVKE